MTLETYINTKISTDVHLNCTDKYLNVNDNNKSTVYFT